MIYLYITALKPYTTVFMNKIEKFNEAITLFTLDFLYVFSDFSKSAESRTKTGWLLILLFFFQSSVNLSHIIQSLYSFYKYRVYQRFCRNKKNLRKIKLKTIKIHSTSSVLNNTLTMGPLLKFPRFEKDLFEKQVSLRVILEEAEEVKEEEP